MAKIDIPPELGQRLREYRLKSGIRGKAVAQYIGKTPAYISKLEKGDFKSIDEEALHKIVNYITGDENGFERFIDDFLASASEDDIQSQLDIMRFDMLERVLPVSESLVDYINAQIHELGIDVQYLVDYINKNDDYDESFLERHGLDSSTIQYNYFYSLSGEQSEMDDPKTFILYRLSAVNVRSILTRRTTVSPHFIIFALVYNLLKLKNGGAQPEAEQWRLKSEASGILTENKFYTIFDRSRAFSASTQPSDYIDFLNSYDKEVYSRIDEIFDQIEYLANYNVVYANEKLEGIAKNMNEDASFALSFMSLPVSKLSMLSVSQKKRFLEITSTLIDDYLSTVGSNTAVELY